MTRVKNILVTWEALLSLLSLDGSRRLRFTGLPIDAKIIGVANSAEVHDTVTIKVESESFDEIAAGMPIPQLWLQVEEAV